MKAGALLTVRTASEAFGTGLAAIAATRGEAKAVAEALREQARKGTPSAASWDAIVPKLHQTKAMLAARVQRNGMVGGWVWDWEG